MRPSASLGLIFLSLSSLSSALPLGGAPTSNLNARQENPQDGAPARPVPFEPFRRALAAKPEGTMIIRKVPGGIKHVDGLVAEDSQDEEGAVEKPALEQAAHESRRFPPTSTDPTVTQGQEEQEHGEGQLEPRKFKFNIKKLPGSTQKRSIDKEDALEERRLFGHIGKIAKGATSAHDPRSLDDHHEADLEERKFFSPGFKKVAGHRRAGEADSKDDDQEGSTFANNGAPVPVAGFEEGDNQVDVLARRDPAIRGGPAIPHPGSNTNLGSDKTGKGGHRPPARTRVKDEFLRHPEDLQARSAPAAAAADNNLARRSFWGKIKGSSKKVGKVAAPVRGVAPLIPRSSSGGRSLDEAGFGQYGQSPPIDGELLGDEGELA